MNREWNYRSARPRCCVRRRIGKTTPTACVVGCVTGSGVEVVIVDGRLDRAPCVARAQPVQVVPKGSSCRLGGRLLALLSRCNVVRSSPLVVCAHRISGRWKTTMRLCERSRVCVHYSVDATRVATEATSKRAFRVPVLPVGRLAPALRPRVVLGVVRLVVSLVVRRRRAFAHHSVVSRGVLAHALGRSRYGRVRIGQEVAERTSRVRCDLVVRH